MKRGRPWVWLSVLSRMVVLGLVMLAALWPTYLNLRYAYDNARIVGLSHGAAWEAFYRVTRAMDAWLGQEDLVAGLFFGHGTSPTLFGVSFVDPVVVPGLLLSQPGVWVSLWPALVAVGLAVLLAGRGFCSFGCPASLLFAANLRLRELAEERVPPLRAARRALPDGLRWGILGGGTIAAVATGAWVWQLLLPYVLVSSELTHLVLGSSVSVGTGVVAFLLLADLLVFPGEICRALCPLGGLLGRTSRLALVQIRAAGPSCPEGCRTCSEICDLSLDPRHGAVLDCSLCGRCVPDCPAGRLSVGVRPRWPRRLRWTAAVGFALALLWPGRAGAHHYKGLPHYGYFDNYPQTPTDEFIAQDGPWEMHFTIYNFQGMRREDVDAPDDVQIFLVVYDLKKNLPFGGPARIAIRAGEREVAAFEKRAEQESVFYLHTRIPSADHLSLRVSFADAQGKPVALASSFRLPGEGGRNPLVWVGAGLVVLLFLMLVASKQTRPVRRPETRNA